MYQADSFTKLLDDMADEMNWLKKYQKLDRKRKLMLIKYRDVLPVWERHDEPVPSNFTPFKIPHIEQEPEQWVIRKREEKLIKEAQKEFAKPKKAYFIITRVEANKPTTIEEDILRMCEDVRETDAFLYDVGLYDAF